MRWELSCYILLHRMSWGSKVVQNLFLPRVAAARCVFLFYSSEVAYFSSAYQEGCRLWLVLGCIWGVLAEGQDALFFSISIVTVIDTT